MSEKSPGAARSPSAIRRASAQPAVRAVLSLGVTQIVTWGTTLYALGVLGQPIIQETGWSRSLVYGGLTAGLIAASLVSTWTGRLVDRWGGRRVMALGSCLNALGLVWLSLVGDPVSYLAAWILLGPAMRMTLYDAAFAALVQVTPSRGRRAISILTLFGGFASTIFWPIGHALEAEIGWRSTFLVFAAANLLLCLPLHWAGLARRETAPAAEDGAAPPGAAATPGGHPVAPLEGRARVLALVLFGGVMSSMGFVIGAMAVHLVDLIAASGLAVASAVFIASFKGVGQVAGRVWDLAFARRVAPISVARISVVLMPVSFLVLVFGGASFATAMVFTLVLGVSNGLVTIVRGVVPLALFGTQGYGSVLGVLATPYLMLNALAPLILAGVIDAWGFGAGEAVLLATAAAGFIGMEITAVWIRRRLRDAASG